MKILVAFILMKAFFIISSSWIKAILIYPSPSLPKALPGINKIPVCSNKSLTKSIDFWYKLGIFAQIKMKVITKASEYIA